MIAYTGETTLQVIGNVTIGTADESAPGKVVVRLRREGARRWLEVTITQTVGDKDDPVAKIETYQVNVAEVAAWGRGTAAMMEER